MRVFLIYPKDTVNANGRRNLFTSLGLVTYGEYVSKKAKNKGKGEASKKVLNFF